MIKGEKKMKCFEAKQIKRSHTVKLAASPEVVFPLLCPVREEEWIPNWHYELVYSKSGFNEEGCIFRTDFVNGIEALWVCTKFDRENLEVEFLVHLKDLTVSKKRLLLCKNDDGSSSLCFEYEDTAITEKGNELVENYTDEAHIKNVSGLVMLLNHYLQTGRMQSL
jgi:hypothetical protein